MTGEFQNLELSFIFLSIADIFPSQSWIFCSLKGSFITTSLDLSSSKLNYIQKICIVYCQSCLKTNLILKLLPKFPKSNGTSSYLRILIPLFFFFYNTTFKNLNHHTWQIRNATSRTVKNCVSGVSCINFLAALEWCYKSEIIITTSFKIKICFTKATADR